MKKAVFESARLSFYKFTPNDVELIFELNKDPEVTKYTHDPMKDMHQAESVLKDLIIPQYEFNNFGRWAVYKKDSDTFIGWCGLKLINDVQEIDLGYRFIKRYWGYGFATEAAKATLDFAFSYLNISEITARALPENKHSIKVLEKCGMQNIGVQHCEGTLAVTFKINKQDYLALNNAI